MLSLAWLVSVFVRLRIQCIQKSMYASGWPLMRLMMWIFVIFVLFFLFSWCVGCRQEWTRFDNITSCTLLLLLLAALWRWMRYLFVYLFIYLFVCPFVRLFVRMHACMHLFYNHELLPLIPSHWQWWVAALMLMFVGIY